MLLFSMKDCLRLDCILRRYSNNRSYPAEPPKLNSGIPTVTHVEAPNLAWKSCPIDLKVSVTKDDDTWYPLETVFS